MTLKRQLTLLVASLLIIAPVMAFGTVAIAQAATDASTTANTTATDDDEQTTEDKATALKERLAKRKTAYTKRLTTAETTRLTGRCKAAQAVTAAVAKQMDTSLPKRIKAYEDASTKLKVIQERLDAQENSTDTADLKTQITQLDAEIAAYKTTVAAYESAMDDVSEMTCTDDITAFKATLEEARTARTSLLAQTKKIRTLLGETIKTTLQGLGEKLKTGAAAGTESSN